MFNRGLGDRYTKSILNGIDIPGLDPDRNTVQMDLFPTNILDNVIAIKSSTAEMPADFTGGIVDVVTKESPQVNNFQFPLERLTILTCIITMITLDILVEVQISLVWMTALGLFRFIQKNYTFWKFLISRFKPRLPNTLPIYLLYVNRVWVIIVFNSGGNQKNVGKDGENKIGYFGSVSTRTKRNITKMFKIIIISSPLIQVF